MNNGGISLGFLKVHCDDSLALLTFSFLTFSFLALLTFSFLVFFIGVKLLEPRIAGQVTFPVLVNIFGDLEGVGNDRFQDVVK